MSETVLPRVAKNYVYIQGSKFQLDKNVLGEYNK
jgi:hypothetical protein